MGSSSGGGAIPEVKIPELGIRTDRVAIGGGGAKAPTGGGTFNPDAGGANAGGTINLQTGQTTNPDVTKDPGTPTPISATDSMPAINPNPNKFPDPITLGRTTGDLESELDAEAAKRRQLAVRQRIDQEISIRLKTPGRQLTLLTNEQRKAGPNGGRNLLS